MLEQLMSISPTSHRVYGKVAGKNFLPGEAAAIVAELNKAIEEFGPITVCFATNRGGEQGGGVKFATNVTELKASLGSLRGSGSPFIAWTDLDDSGFSVYTDEVTAISVEGKIWTRVLDGMRKKRSAAVAEYRARRTADNSYPDGYGVFIETHWSQYGEAVAKLFSQAGEMIEEGRVRPNYHGADCVNPYNHRWVNCEERN